MTTWYATAVSRPRPASALLSFGVVARSLLACAAFAVSIGLPASAAWAQDDSCVSDPSLCVENAFCETSTEECMCLPGFSGDGTSDCTDIDECTADPCGVSAGRAVACMNTEGSYSCTCAAGYTERGGGCEDVDECGMTPDPCGISDMAATSCTNTSGSFLCSCEDGYATMGQGSRCEDVDECAEDASRCENGTCSSSTPPAPPGTWQCECQPGFMSSGGDTPSCEPIPGVDAGPARDAGPGEEDAGAAEDAGVTEGSDGGGMTQRDAGTASDTVPRLPASCVCRASSPQSSGPSGVPSSILAFSMLAWWRRRVRRRSKRPLDAFRTETLA